MHQCSAYCTPAEDIHCYEVLVPPTITLADVESFYRYIYQERFIRVGRAREVDVTQWREELTDWAHPPEAWATQAMLLWGKGIGIGISRNDYDQREREFYATHPEVVQRLTRATTSPL